VPLFCTTGSGILARLPPDLTLTIGRCFCVRQPLTVLESGRGRSGLVNGDGIDPFEIRVVGGDGGNPEICHDLQGERII